MRAILARRRKAPLPALSGVRHSAGVLFTATLVYSSATRCCGSRYQSSLPSCLYRWTHKASSQSVVSYLNRGVDICWQVCRATHVGGRAAHTLVCRVKNGMCWTTPCTVLLFDRFSNLFRCGYTARFARRAPRSSVLRVGRLLTPRSRRPTCCTYRNHTCTRHCATTAHHFRLHAAGHRAPPLHLHG